jgi:hypothetical protein
MDQSHSSPDVHGPDVYETDSAGRWRRWTVRGLHLVACAAYVVASVVPVMEAPRDTSSHEIRLNALGDMGSDRIDGPSLLVWLLVASTVVGAQRFPVSRAWGLLSLLAGATAALLWGGLVRTPPLLMWDGQMPDGTPTGGMLVAEPTPWITCAALTAAGLVAGGLCAVVWGRWPSARTVPPAS